MCSKCGKANAVTRKYCTGCGANLLKPVEPVEPEPEVVEEPIEEPIPGSPDYVPPSETTSEQVEMKRDEPDSYEVIEESPVSEDVSMDPEVEEEVTESEPVDDDRGRAVVADILEKVKAAEERSRGEEVKAPSETELEPPPVETFEEIDEPVAFEESEVEVTEEEYEEEVEEEIEEPEVHEPESAPPEESSVKEPIPAKSPPVYMTADEPARDEKVRMYESDISAFLIEREQLESELDKLRTRLDEEVDRYHTVAEVKRTRAESIERDLSLAKKEHSDASKEYKNADNRRKKELSNADKRIRDVEKRIKKARESKEKRIQEIEKERRKREEEARKG